MAKTPSPSFDASDAPALGETQRVLLVTGLAGAGKSTALSVLEDIGWETIDNFPVRLLEGLMDTSATQPMGPSAPLAIGFDTRTRGFVPSDIIALAKSLASRRDIAITFMFLDCSGQELERRFNETRRRHPMAQERAVSDAIAAERELLGPLRRWADIVIDTSALSKNELQDHVRELFADSNKGAMTLTLSSFGFARGMQPLADLVFDMRFLDNPHWVPELRELTGRDAAVGAHITQDPAFEAAFGQIRDLLLTLLPRYNAKGKPHVHIAFGCTGGRHRSVFTTERMATALREAGFSPTVRHRNLRSRAVDEVEGPRTP